LKQHIDISTSTDTLNIDLHGEHILKVVLNRPKSANAFNTQMAWDLVSVFEALVHDTQGIRVVILTGAGDKAFCAGGDLKERNGMSDEQWQAQHLVYERMIRALTGCPIPVIGAINGAAFGGGCEIVAALDFVYAANTAKFAQTEVSLGIIPGAGGTQTLARAVGEKRAKEIVLSARVFSAQQALDWGLANAVYPPNELSDAVMHIAKAISDNAPIAVKQAKQAIQKGLHMSLSDGLAFEIEAYNRCVPTNDRKEGVSAFNEKRKPNFRGT